MHSHDGNEEKGKSSLRHGLFSSRYHEVTTSSFRSSPTSTPSIFNTTTHARSRREQTRTTRIFSTFIRHLDMTNAFPFPDCFHAPCTIMFLAPFSPLSHKTVCVETRTGCALVSRLSCFYSALLIPSICLFTLHPSHRSLIDTLRSRPAYIFSNPTLI